ncbi:hypothetical protein XELAEV_18035374mg [Xenopus laevis]|uniref:Uncharacterized protein n=1 Tax=Xenopus laevis TaxID=8355 RepID=A0A974HBZ7_XENLA|nr:hypothetical protein XELAEV_18035374mg [Xenopus laevis]
MHSIHLLYRDAGSGWWLNYCFQQHNSKFPDYGVNYVQFSCYTKLMSTFVYLIGKYLIQNEMLQEVSALFSALEISIF